MNQTKQDTKDEAYEKIAMGGMKDGIYKQEDIPDIIRQNTRDREARIKAIIEIERQIYW